MMTNGRWESGPSAARRLLDYLRGQVGVTVKANVAIVVAITLNMTVIALKL